MKKNNKNQKKSRIPSSQSFDWTTLTEPRYFLDERSQRSNKKNVFLSIKGDAFEMFGPSGKSCFSVGRREYSTSYNNLPNLLNKNEFTVCYFRILNEFESGVPEVQFAL